MARWEHSGNAAATTLSSAITSSSTTINITSATGWPTGAVGAFWVTIDAGTASEEKVLITSRTGTALTVSSRGADSTTATSHANGAAIIHSFSATEADAANAHIEATTGHGATGAVVGTTNTQTLTNKNLADATNVFAVPTYGRAYRATTQLVTTATWTAVTYDGTDLRNGATLASGQRLTVPKAGLYLISALVSLSPGATGFRSVNVRKNAAGAIGGGTALIQGYVLSTGGTDDTTVSAAAVVALAASDYIEMFVYQNGGGNLNLQLGADKSKLDVVYLGPAA